MNRSVHTLLLSLPLVACTATSALFTGTSTTQGDPSPVPEGSASMASDAGSAKRVPASHGLCGKEPRCVPDHQDGCMVGSVKSDAGVFGCRITRVDSELTTQCERATSDGLDGASCEKGADCAPGFDCVEGEKGAVCRRYCCFGTCKTQLAMNGSPTFCDVGVVASETRQVIPVCMPVKACELLRDGDCASNETCAIVTMDGQSSCIARGAAKAGDACNETHCDANLTCLGSLGDRRCYKLCRVAANDCAPTESCITGSVFPDTAFGVCRAY